MDSMEYFPLLREHEDMGRPSCCHGLGDSSDLGAFGLVEFDGQHDAHARVRREESYRGDGYFYLSDIVLSNGGHNTEPASPILPACCNTLVISAVAKISILVGIFGSEITDESPFHSS